MDDGTGKLPFSVAFISGQPVYEQLETAILQAILSGQLPAGSLLPDCHAIASALLIHPDTVRQVLVSLRDAGWIHEDDERRMVLEPEAGCAERVRVMLIRRHVAALREQARRLGVSTAKLNELLNEEKDA